MQGSIQQLKAYDAALQKRIQNCRAKGDTDTLASLLETREFCQFELWRSRFITQQQQRKKLC